MIALNDTKCPNKLRLLKNMTIRETGEQYVIANQLYIVVKEIYLKI